MNWFVSSSFYSTPSWNPNEIEYLFNECFKILCCWCCFISTIIKPNIVTYIWIRYNASTMIINFECVLPHKNFKITKLSFLVILYFVCPKQSLDVIHHLFVLLSHYSKPLRYKWRIIISDQVSIIFAVFSLSAYSNASHNFFAKSPQYLFIDSRIMCIGTLFISNSFQWSKSRLIFRINPSTIISLECFIFFNLINLKIQNL